MIATIYCDKMETDVTDFIKACCTCLKLKKNKQTTSKLPPQEVTITPWKSVCIDLIGPQTVTDRLVNYRILNVTIFVDTATGWFEMTELLDKTSTKFNQILKNILLACYPRIRKVIFHNENEFKKDFSPLLRDFSIKPTLTTIKSQYTNVILE